MPVKNDFIVATKDNMKDFKDKFIVYAYFTKLDRPLYVGETGNFYDREARHRCLAGKPKYLGSVSEWVDYSIGYWEKYEEMPVLKVLCVCKTKAEAQQKEVYFRALFEAEMGFQLYNQRECGPLKGSKLSPKTKLKMRRAKDKVKRGVVQYTKDNVFVASYPSMVEAERQTGFKNGHISEACSGKRKTLKGFRWKYAEAV